MFSPSKKYLYAIVGASSNPEKYGHKVLANLQGKGFSLIAINPHEKEILGVKTYSKLSLCPKKPDVAVLIVPPQIGIEIAKECKNLGINKIWCQPGAESDEILEFCKKSGVECVGDGSCIMIETNQNKKHS